MVKGTSIFMSRKGPKIGMGILDFIEEDIFVGVKSQLNLLLDPFHLPVVVSQRK